MIRIVEQPFFLPFDLVNVQEGHFLYEVNHIKSTYSLEGSELYSLKQYWPILTQFEQRISSEFQLNLCIETQCSGKLRSSIKSYFCRLNYRILQINMVNIFYMR